MTCGSDTKRLFSLVMRHDNQEISYVGGTYIDYSSIGWVKF